MNEFVIFYCPKCDHAFSGSPTEEKICPECHIPTHNTTFDRDEWRQLTENQKANLKLEWSSKISKLTAITQSIAYVSSFFPTSHPVIEKYQQLCSQNEWKNCSLDAKLEKLNETLHNIIENYTKIFVSTGDWNKPYDVIAPVYYSISNRGFLSSEIDRKTREYKEFTSTVKLNWQESPVKADWGFLYGNYDVGSWQFESAFYIATEELRRKALRLGADAVICMRQDIDIETEHINNFYLQMYGTAIKFKE